MQLFIMNIQTFIESINYKNKINVINGTIILDKNLMKLYNTF